MTDSIGRYLNIFCPKMAQPPTGKKLARKPMLIPVAGDIFHYLPILLYSIHVCLVSTLCVPTKGPGMGFSMVMSRLHVVIIIQFRKRRPWYVSKAYAFCELLLRPIAYSFWTNISALLPRNAMHSAVSPRHVVCLSVCTSVCLWRSLMFFTQVKILRK